MRLVSRFDEVVGSYVGHDFGARQDLDMELIFDFLELLERVVSFLVCDCRSFSIPEHCE